MYGYHGYPSYEEYGDGYSEFTPWVPDPSYEDLIGEIELIVIEFVGRYVPPPSPRPIADQEVFQSGTFVGWSPPPHPADVIVSFNPRASKQEQAKAVLLDYYHDNALRSWADNGNVRKCFIGGSDPKKEDHDPLLLVAAYLDRKHKVWSCSGDAGAKGPPVVAWKDLDAAVQAAIANRTKLGPLPKAFYSADPSKPTVIYYYDNDWMKRISYPLGSIPGAMNPDNPSGARYWALYSGPGDDAHVDAGLDKPHTLIAIDPRKIQIERENPGWKNKAALKQILAKYPKDFQHSGDCPSCSGKLDMNLQLGSAGGWGEEGFDWDRDVAGTGIIGSITGAILALASAILTATGVGAVVGVPLAIATPLIVAGINDLDIGLHTGDFGAGLAGLATSLIQAAASAGGQAGFSIPPAAVKALSSTVSAIATAVRSGQEKKLDFAQIWDETAKKVKGYSKLGDKEAIAIAQMLSGQGPAAGHVFTQGYLAGKFLDMTAISAIAKLLQGLTNFYDPRILNLGLLGMGMGHVAKTQGNTSLWHHVPEHRAPEHHASAAHAAHGEFDSVGQIFTQTDPHDDLAAFIHLHLKPRYGLGAGAHFTGFTCPEGYDVVASDHQIACAYRRKAPCLSGFTNEHGTFVCSDWDYPACPPGMGNVSGSPKNWCFPRPDPVVHGFFTGQIVPPSPPPIDYGPLSRGCPQGYWWDPLRGVCRLAGPLPKFAQDFFE